MTEMHADAIRSTLLKQQQICGKSLNKLRALQLAVRDGSQPVRQRVRLDLGFCWARHSHLSDSQVALPQHRPEPRVQHPLQQWHDGLGLGGGFAARRRQAICRQLCSVDEAVNCLS